MPQPLDKMQDGSRRAEAAKAGEPAALTRGKLFHRRLQESWRERHGGVGEARIEKELRRVLGRRGRPDVQVDIDVQSDVDGGQVLFVAVLEAKSRDFTRLSSTATHQLIGRDKRQVLRYLDLLLASLSDDATVTSILVAPSIIYETGPVSVRERAEIENYLDAAGVGVIWEDESIEVARARLLLNP